MTHSRSDFLADRFWHRFGLFSTSGERSIWMHGQSAAVFTKAGVLLEELRAEYPRLRFAFTSGDADTREQLRVRYPSAVVLPPPFAGAAAARRYIKNLNPRVIIALQSENGLGAATLARAAQRKIPVVLVEWEDPPQPQAHRAAGTSQRLEHVFTSSPQRRDHLRGDGLPADRISLLERGAAANAQIRAVLGQLLRRNLKALRHAERAASRNWFGLLLRALESRAGKRFLARRSERIDDLETLRRRLGNPRAILCLGNGPSSEDPRLQAVEYDRLFRVNWQWSRRNMLTDPDVVFTGDQKTVRMLQTHPACLFAVQTVEAEQRLLLVRIFDPRAPRFAYISLERLPTLLNEREWDARPTNGVAMLALAVALQPERLVVAGIDLFQHPAGTYPGDVRTENAYAPAHDRDVELEIIEAILDEYRGELVLLSDVLRESLRQRRADASPGKTPRALP